MHSGETPPKRRSSDSDRQIATDSVEPTKSDRVEISTKSDRVSTKSDGLVERTGRRSPSRSAKRNGRAVLLVYSS